MIHLNTQTILVPTDFSITAGKALAHAAFLAQVTKGSLFLLHVERKKETSGNDHFDELRQLAFARQEKRVQLLALVKDIHDKYGIPVFARIIRGQLTAAITRVSKNRHIGLIVMGTQGEDSNSHMFFGNNSNRVLSKSSIPVMTVRTDTKRSGYSRILLPLDSSSHSRQKVNFAIELAKLFAAKICVLGLLGENENHFRYKIDVIINQVKKLCSEAGVNFNAHISQTNGPAETTLAMSDLLKTDLIISMTDEGSGPLGFLGEKYDETLVNQARVPVLSIPPEPNDESLESISVAGY
jgi:nucleotide-binding universal stress UspA family protein